MRPTSTQDAVWARLARHLDITGTHLGLSIFGQMFPDTAFVDMTDSQAQAFLDVLERMHAPREVREP